MVWCGRVDWAGEQGKRRVGTLSERSGHYSTKHTMEIHTHAPSSPHPSTRAAPLPNHPIILPPTPTQQHHLTPFDSCPFHNAKTAPKDSAALDGLSQLPSARRFQRLTYSAPDTAHACNRCISSSSHFPIRAKSQMRRVLAGTDKSARWTRGVSGR